MNAWLRLIRWNNLLIILLTQLLAWACVVLPVGYYTHVPLLLTPVNFACLCLSTILIAAAGYIINDYFDIRIDAINRPEKVVLETAIPRRMAIMLHSILNVVGLLLAGYVARQAHHLDWLALQATCTLLLWFYSTHFKRQFMTGNLVVALLTSLTIAALMLYEPALHPYYTQRYFIHTPMFSAPNPVWLLGFYAFFAFMLTWMREIVKDMEDFKGDEAEGCVTMPIRWGLQRSMRFTQILCAVVVAPLVLVAIKLLLAGWLLLSGYTFFAIIIPVGIWGLFLQQQATSAHYHKASFWLKMIMVMGVGSLIIYLLQAHA
ncbi:MAG: geranylgeranylglycerol-phosphate geranylgeranyltransferase [Flavipsychrobacter sp.]|nr:geranylgeranylglycerol-phosphate geranylgeranyltransferase [Flavipsychrobacter sp.]